MTNSDVDQYRLFIDNLQREEFRHSALTDIKNLLILKPPREAVSTIQNVGITKIVRCLNVPEKYVQIGVVLYS